MSSDFHSSSELELRLRRTCAELDRRLRSGETGVAQQLLANDAEISADEDLAIELVYTEFVTLEELGAAPSPHEILDRYPQWKDRLERLLKVHDAFRDNEIDLTRSSDTVAGIDSTRDGISSRSNGPAGPARRQVGQYEILEEIDRGGMGIVYKARQRGLNRIVAIKLIRSDDASDSERARFRAEAESAAKLQHPNIVQIHEVGEEDGCEFLSMEYIEGGSLEKRLARERLSIGDSARLMATLAKAIHYAHEQGIVHRDLKPGNILLSGDVPKIADFGLAKRMLVGSDAQTQTGAVLGTPCYMSPEQAEGKTRDIAPPTDVYALGAILYELLVGRPPFQGDTPLETMDLIRSREPERPAAITPKLPRDLETICLKCLRKEPMRRYVSAQALADDLHRFLDHEPIRARRVSLVERGWRWSCRRPAISGLVAMLLLVSMVAGAIVVEQQRHVGELAKSAEATKRNAAKVQQRAEAATQEAGANLREAKQAIERLSLLGANLHDQPGMGKTAQRTVEEALAQYRVMLEKYGNDHSVRWEAARGFERAGFIQLELGQFKSAEQTLKQGVQLSRTLQQNPQIDYERAGILILLAHTQRSLQNWKESEASYHAAIELLEDLVAKFPTENVYATRLANTRVNLCVVLMQDDRHDIAQQAYCRAIQLHRGAIERSAGFETSSTSTDEDVNADEAPREEILAAQTLRRRVVQHGDGLLVRLVQGRYLSELALTIDDLGLLLQERGDSELAQVAIREALELRQLGIRHARGEDWRRFFLARSHRHVGQVEYSRRNYQAAATEFEDALLVLKKLAADFPNRVNYQSRLGIAHTDIGRVRRDMKQFEVAQQNHHSAVAIHERLVKNDPSLETLKDDLANSLYHMGRTLVASGHPAEAIERLERTLELDPDSARAANELAWLLVMAPDHQIRDPQRALPLAERAVELGPQSGNYWNSLGVAHYRCGNDDDAIAALMQSVELRGGGDALDWHFLAMAHARKGDRDLAVEWFERARQWCLTQNPLSDELRRTQAEAGRVIESLGR